LVPSCYKDAIDSINRTPEQQVLADEFYGCVKRNLDKKFKIMYVDKNLLTHEKLVKISKVYMDELAS
jgi:hypothetical protein